MPDRKKSPPLQALKKIKIAEPVLHHLDNRIPLFSINAGEQDVVKIELLFNAGKWQETTKTIALATAKMLKEGTKSFSSKEIADKIEFYGASLEVETSSDIASVTLFSLNKHLIHLLPLVKEILTVATFSQKELDTFIKNTKQKLLVEKKKVEYLAEKKFHEVLFGNGHPYGYFFDEKDFNALTRNDLLKFYKENYTSDNCRIMVSGKVPNSTLKLLNQYFGQKDWKSKEKQKPISRKISSEKKKIHFIRKKDSVQSAIRIGNILFNKTHKDYFGMFVLNTVLGGYFGSRLMANIREDKGYTYGIYSRLGSLLHEGYFFIATEVGTDVGDAAVKEIYSEISRLRNELIPKEELQLVKNYLLGTLLSKIDGAFNLSETIKGLILYNLDTNHFYRLINTIKNISSKELLELARKYFDEKKFYEVMVGK